MEWLFVGVRVREECSVYVGSCQRGVAWQVVTRRNDDHHVFCYYQAQNYAKSNLMH